jgi:uncharacterized membrane protein
MTYKVKNTVVSLLAGVSLLAAYCIYAIGKVQSDIDVLGDMKFWAATILVFIGIGVAAMIVIQILFHIVLSIAMAVKEQMRSGKCDDKELEKALKLEMVEDEMDKLIALKSMRIGFCIVGTGFIAALAALVLNCQPAVMLNILFFSFGIGSMTEGVAQLFFYRRGVKNG